MNLFSIIRMLVSAAIKPKQQFSIPEFPKGKLLDIGGGGEGVIAQSGGTNVVSIDKFMSEINEAREKAPDAHWMAADGTDLPFEMNSFDHATAFFSCMYMPEEVKQKVFRETYRVLKTSAEFWIWDVNMEARMTVFAVRIQADLPGNKTIRTVYGVRAKDQSGVGISEMLQEAGFHTEIIHSGKHSFSIKARTV